MTVCAIIHSKTEASVACRSLSTVIIFSTFVCVFSGSKKNRNRINVYAFYALCTTSVCCVVLIC